MLDFFLGYLATTNIKEVKTQLLQTLAIMIQNLKNQSYIFYMFSNNHINDLIVHKFDFSDEELLAYYISLMKSCSMKLDPDTVQFFYNERLNDLPLFTEAIRFFNHPESMVRIAVRTISLNVYKVEDANVQKFIVNRTAVPYFSNLAWYIRDQCAVIASTYATTKASDSISIGAIKGLIDEHLDRLYYLGDVFGCNREPLSAALSEQLLEQFALPRVVASLIPNNKPDKLEPLVAFQLVSQLLHIFSSRNGLVAGIVGAIFCTTGGGDDVSPYRRAVVGCLDNDDDRVVLQGLCLLLTTLRNVGVEKDLLQVADLRAAQPAEHGTPAAATADLRAKYAPFIGNLAELMAKEVPGPMGPEAAQRALDMRLTRQQGEFESLSKTVTREAAAADAAAGVAAGGAAGAEPAAPGGSGSKFGARFGKLTPTRGKAKEGGEGAAPGSVAADFDPLADEQPPAAAAAAADGAAAAAADGEVPAFDENFLGVSMEANDVEELIAPVPAADEGATDSPVALERARSDQAIAGIAAAVSPGKDGGAADADLLDSVGGDAPAAAVPITPEPAAPEAAAAAAAGNTPAAPPVEIDPSHYAALADATSTTLPGIVQKVVGVFPRCSQLRIVTVQCAMALLTELTAREDAVKSTLGEAERAVLTQACDDLGKGLLEKLGGDGSAAMFAYAKQELAKTRSRFNIEYTVTDPGLLLELDDAPGKSVDLAKKWPVDAEEHLRKDIRLFMLLRQWLTTLALVSELKTPVATMVDSLFAPPFMNVKSAVDLSQRLGAHWKMPCVSGPRREQRYLIIDLHAVMIVEPDLTQLRHGAWYCAWVRQTASVLQVSCTIHKFDRCRLHMEAKAGNAGTEGLPDKTWGLALVFNTPDECAEAGRQLEQARDNLLTKRTEGLREFFGSVQ